MVPVIPESAPFTLEQRAWLNGYLAGLFSRTGSQPAAAAAAKPAPTLRPLTILFGSQTGTAETLARRAAKEAGKRGFAATVLDMAQTELPKLAAEQAVLVITSTYGDGEPPDNARALHTALSAEPVGADAARLSRVRFSVCALGDTNYTQFCRCGQDFDRLLEKHGATRVAPRVDCDVDYETAFSGWLEKSLTALSQPHDSAAGAAATPSGAASVSVSAAAPGVSVAPRDTASSGYSRSNPYPARVLSARRLNAAESAKEVYHVEFDLGASGLAYQPGDALGVWPSNCPELVNEVLTALACDGEEAVPAPDGTTTSLRRALAEVYDLGKPTPELLERFGTGGGVATAVHHIIDLLLARADVKLAPVDFVRTLKRLQPRLYSISSSPRAQTGQVHLTVGAVRYELSARRRKGVCSTFLADRVVAGVTRAGVFVHHNPAFRLPVNPETPVIMIGPGTGIAPFRAFLHDRRATGASGRNWLLFGDQRAATDFLYRDELEGFAADGLLTRLSLAWSRDQQEKIYVQTRMLEHAAELYAWLEAGAHVYVCGDASRMAKDVDAALHTVVERGGGRTAAQAAEYVQSLRAAKRYCRDVY